MSTLHLISIGSGIKMLSAFSSKSDVSDQPLTNDFTQGSSTWWKCQDKHRSQRVNDAVSAMTEGPTDNTLSYCSSDTFTPSDKSWQQIPAHSDPHKYCDTVTLHKRHRQKKGNEEGVAVSGKVRSQQIFHFHFGYFHFGYSSTRMTAACFRRRVEEGACLPARKL